MEWVAPLGTAMLQHDTSFQLGHVPVQGRLRRRAIEDPMLRVSGVTHWRLGQVAHHLRSDPDPVARTLRMCPNTDENTSWQAPSRCRVQGGGQCISNCAHFACGPLPGAQTRSWFRSFLGATLSRSASAQSSTSWISLIVRDSIQCFMYLSCGQPLVQSIRYNPSPRVWPKVANWSCSRPKSRHSAHMLKVCRCSPSGMDSPTLRQLGKLWPPCEISLQSFKARSCGLHARSVSKVPKFQLEDKLFQTLGGECWYDQGPRLWMSAHEGPTRQETCLRHYRRREKGWKKETKG